jgi:hypothetical protein
MKTFYLSTLCVLALFVSACSDKQAPVLTGTKAVMSGDEMAKFHCSGSLEKIGPLIDACAAEKSGGASSGGANCAALEEGKAKVAATNKKTPGACSPKIRF